MLGDECRQAQAFIQLAHQNETGVGGDARPLELDLQKATPTRFPSGGRDVPELWSAGGAGQQRQVRAVVLHGEHQQQVVADVPGGQEVFLDVLVSGGPDRRPELRVAEQFDGAVGRALG